MKKQLIILWISIGLLVLAILFPPWTSKVEFQGYGFLFSPPEDAYRIESSRLAAEVLIIVLLTAGAFYTAKVSPSSIQITQKMRKGFKLMIAVVVGAGVVTFVGVLLGIHLQAKKAQPISAPQPSAQQLPQSNKQQAIGDQPKITTTLHYAADQGNLVDVERCLQKEIAVDARNKAGKTPLMYAASSSKDQLLVKDVRDNSIDDLLKVIAYLITKGADVNAKDNAGDTPLMGAATRGRLDIVEYLIAKGADVNAKDSYKRTPLFWAASRGHLGVVMHLIAKGADVNSRDDYGNTPLKGAMKFGYQNVVDFLKQHGAKE